MNLGQKAWLFDSYTRHSVTSFIFWRIPTNTTRCGTVEPWGSVHLETLTVAQLVKQLPHILWNPKVHHCGCTTFSTARHFCVYWASHHLIYLRFIWAFPVVDVSGCCSLHNHIGYKSEKQNPWKILYFSYLHTSIKKIFQLGGNCYKRFYWVAVGMRLIRLFKYVWILQ